MLNLLLQFEKRLEKKYKILIISHNLCRKTSREFICHQLEIFFLLTDRVAPPMNPCVPNMENLENPPAPLLEMKGTHQQKQTLLDHVSKISSRGCLVNPRVAQKDSEIMNTGKYVKHYIHIKLKFYMFDLLKKLII